MKSEYCLNALQNVRWCKWHYTWKNQLDTNWALNDRYVVVAWIDRLFGYTSGLVVKQRRLGYSSFSCLFLIFIFKYSAFGRLAKQRELPVVHIKDEGWASYSICNRLSHIGKSFYFAYRTTFHEFPWLFGILMLQ